MLSKWLAWKLRDPSPYRKFKLTEIDEKIQITPEVKSHLVKLFTEARFDQCFLLAVAKRLGWAKVVTELVTPSQPTVATARRGFFGEVLVCAMLTEIFGYLIPVQKLRFAISANQSLPGTDVIAIKKDGGTISEICFVESKLRTTADTYFAVQGYKQLKEDYSQRIPDMIRFVLARLHERKDPLFYEFLEYVFDRRDLTNIERFSLGLTCEHGSWTETVLENLEEEVNNTSLPNLVVQRTRIKNLATLVKEVFQAIGVEAVLDDD